MSAQKPRGRHRRPLTLPGTAQDPAVLSEIATGVLHIVSPVPDVDEDAWLEPFRAGWTDSSLEIARRFLSFRWVRPGAIAEKRRKEGGPR